MFLRVLTAPVVPPPEMWDWFGIIGGFGLLLAGGDLLVRGVCGLALRLHVPTLIISMTVVAFGTSAPELLIGMQSALKGLPELALGNVVGSNIANVLLVLGVPSLLFRLSVNTKATAQAFYIMLGAMTLFFALSYGGVLGRWQGAILVLALFLALFLSHKITQGDGILGAEAQDETVANLPLWRLSALTLAALIMLPLGADLLIDGAVGISRDFGLSEAVIGLSIVALGTSLPELATSIIAAYRNQGDIVMGNVLGSNLFNLLAVSGVTAVITPITISDAFFAVDFWMLLLSSLLIAPFVVFLKPISKTFGAAMIMCYLIYVIYLLG